MTALSHVLVDRIDRLAPGLEPSTFALISTSSMAARAVVFVHGWGGKPLKTWRHFQDLILLDTAWAETDAYFVGYDSVGDELSLSADIIASLLRRIYPRPPESVLTLGPYSVRPQPALEYEELVLVGHSAGGVVLRLLVLADLQRLLVDGRGHGAGTLTNAHLHLFAPALTGERIAGGRGRLLNTVGFSRMAAVVRGGSPSAQELAQDSQLLTGLREDTGHFASAHPEHRALRARILWAHHDQVVTGRGYRHDASWRARGTSHTTVCKPTAAGDPTMQFAATGSVAAGTAL